MTSLHFRVNPNFCFPTILHVSKNCPQILISQKGGNDHTAVLAVSNYFIEKMFGKL